jgi:PAS domain S-box-containing protein
VVVVDDFRALTPEHLAHLAPPEHGILVPLVADGRVIGTLAAAWPAEDSLRAELVETLQRLAAHVAVALDVLLLSEEERRRRDLERMLATALATMDQPVFVLAEGRVRYANAAAVSEYGYSMEEFAGLPIAEVVAAAGPSSRPPEEAVRDARRGVWTAEHVHRRKDGSEFPASVSLGHIADESGTAVGQVLSVRNVTEERRIAEQLRQTEKLAAIGELVAGVAHEINNPLTGISALSELLLDDGLDDALGAEQRESVRLIKREADRAVAVIRDLLVFSRKADPRHIPVDVNALVERTLRLRAYSLRAADVEVRLELDPELPPVRGDEQKLQQLLLNLVVNAEQALQEAARRQITVRTRRAQGQVTVSVSDTGVGMAEETRRRVFEPFFSTRPEGVGTGLGLSVSYGIVQAHGGDITVRSAPGRGTTFDVLLPTGG